MRTIMVLNAKGGTGKTTLVTNIAAYYASREMNAVIKDYDSQGSAIEWLEQRDSSLHRIQGLAVFKPAAQFATRAWQMRLPENTDRVVVDTPAGLDLTHFINTIKSADKIIIPVSSSAIEVRATVKFIHKLRQVIKRYSSKAEIGVVANRIDINSTSFHSMQSVFSDLGLDIITSLSLTDEYLKSAECGAGILELAHPQVAKDKFEWAPLINWLEDDMVMPQNAESLKLYVVAD